MKTRLLLGLAAFLIFVLVPTDCAKPPHLSLAPSQAVAEIYRLLPETSRIVPGRLSGAPYRPCAGIPPIPELPGGYCDDLPKISSQQGLKLQRAFQQAIANELGQDENWDEPPAMDELREIPYFDGFVSPRPESRAHRLHAEGIWNLLVARKPNRAVELLERAVNISPKDHALRNDLGVATLARGSAFDAWKALSHFDALVGRGADYPNLTDDPPPLVLPTEAPPLEAPTQTPRRIVSPALEPVAKWNLQLTGLSFYAFDYFASKEGPVRTRTDSPWKLEQLKRPQLPTFYRDEFFELVRKELERYRRTSGISAVSVSHQSTLTLPLFRGIPEGAPIGTWLRAFIEEELLLQWAEAAQQSSLQANLKARRALQDIHHLLSQRPETWAPDLRRTIDQIATTSVSQRSELAEAYHLYSVACRKGTAEGLNRAKSEFFQAANQLQILTSPLARRARILQTINSPRDLELMNALAQQSLHNKEFSNAAYALYSSSLSTAYDNQANSSSNSFERATDAATKSNDLLLSARLLSLKGSNALIREELEEFFGSWTPALNTYRRFGETRGISSVIDILLQAPALPTSLVPASLALSDEQIRSAPQISDLTYSFYPRRAAARLLAKLGNETTALSLIDLTLEMINNNPSYRFRNFIRADLLFDRGSLRSRRDHKSCLAELSKSLSLYRNTRSGLRIAEIHFEKALRYRALGNPTLATQSFQKSLELVDIRRRNATRPESRRMASDLLVKLTETYAAHVLEINRDPAAAIAISDLSRNVEIRDSACLILNATCAHEPLPDISKLRDRLSMKSALFVVLKLPTQSSACLLQEKSLACRTLTVSPAQLASLSTLLLQGGLEIGLTSKLSEWLYYQLSTNLLQGFPREKKLLVSIPFEMYRVPFNLLTTETGQYWRQKYLWGFVPSISLALANRPHNTTTLELLVIVDPPTPNFPTLPTSSMSFIHLAQYCSKCLFQTELNQAPKEYIKDLTNAGKFIYAGHGQWLDRFLSEVSRHSSNLSALEDVVLLACSPSESRPTNTELHSSLTELLRLGTERVSLSEHVIKDSDAVELLQEASRSQQLLSNLSDAFQKANQRLPAHSGQSTWVTYYASIP